MPADPKSNVVRLFFDETDLETAWQRFDVAMRRVHELYSDENSSEIDRRRAAVEAAESEIAFRNTFARCPATRLLAKIA